MRKMLRIIVQLLILLTACHIGVLILNMTVLSSDRPLRAAEIHLVLLYSWVQLPLSIISTLLTAPIYLSKFGMILEEFPFVKRQYLFWAAIVPILALPALLGGAAGFFLEVAGWWNIALFATTAVFVALTKALSPFLDRSGG